MVKVFMGKQGSGKTKSLIDMVNVAVKAENGNVVCVERGQKLTYDINHAARLIDIAVYPIVGGYDVLFGFVCGIYSENYDISAIFIDSLFKVAGCSDQTEAAVFLDKLNEFGKANNVKFTITISADTASAVDGIRKFF